LILKKSRVLANRHLPTASKPHCLIRVASTSFSRKALSWPRLSSSLRRNEGLLAKRWQKAKENQSLNLKAFRILRN
jgi:hypothetical protein